MRLFDESGNLKRPSRYINGDLNIPTDIYQEILELENLAESWLGIAGHITGIIHVYQQFAMHVYDVAQTEITGREKPGDKVDVTKSYKLLLDSEMIQTALNPEFMNRLVYLIALSVHHRVGGDKYEHPGDSKDWYENNQFEMDPNIVISRGGNA